MKNMNLLIKRVRNHSILAIHCLMLVVSMVLLPAITVSAAAPTDWSNFQAADVVLGQPNFTSNTAGTTASIMNDAEAIAIDPISGKLFVADEHNHRVLRFASAAVTSGSAAEAVLGQADFTSGSANRGGAVAANTMNDPTGIYVDNGGRLWVVDASNHRVLRFDNAASKSNGANADGVLGQANLTTGNANQGGVVAANSLNGPQGLVVDSSGRLWIGDTFNSRVLRFDNAASKADGANADAVLGQSNLTSSGSATSQSGMNQPTGVAIDSAGRLFVADTTNHRVLRFDNAASKVNGANADAVLGQSDFTSNTAATTQTGMNAPEGVLVDNEGRLYVSDPLNHRILIFNNAATLNNHGGADNPADHVLGQSNFTTGTANTGGISASTLNLPEYIFFDHANKTLWVADSDNNRVLRYSGYSPSPQPVATPHPPNQPPQITTPMPDITVVEGASDQIINPFDYFNDPEGDWVMFYVTGNSNSQVVPNLPVGLKLGNIDQMAIQFGRAGQTEITIQAKEMWSHATTEDTFTVTVLEPPTLSISKSVSNATVLAGERITYTISITNSGPSTATYALISDALPTELTFVNDSITLHEVSTGIVGTTPPYLASGLTILPSQKIAITFAATVNDDVLANQVITNTAQITSTKVITPVRASNTIRVISPTLSISDVVASEVEHTMNFTVTLSRASALPVTVEFTTISDSATANDYTATNGTLTIPAGSISGTMTVQISDDALSEEDESFIVQLSNPTNGTLADEQATGTITDNDLDDDSDGVLDEVENNVPNPNSDGTGDGNGDGEADSSQQNVASLLSTHSQYVTFTAPEGSTLLNVQAIPSPETKPNRYQFPLGLFSWTLIPISDPVTITLTFHTTDTANLPLTYWKYGPTLADPTDHWYDFSFDPQTGTGAEIISNTITLHFVDGQRGDSDLQANGQISDPGGPAIYVVPTALTLTELDAQASIEWHMILAGLTGLLSLVILGFHGSFEQRRS